MMMIRRVEEKLEQRSVPPLHIKDWGNVAVE
jgi:hypothetical protein